MADIDRLLFNVGSVWTFSPAIYRRDSQSAHSTRKLSVPELRREGAGVWAIPTIVSDPMIKRGPRIRLSVLQAQFAAWMRNMQRRTRPQTQTDPPGFSSARA